MAKSSPSEPRTDIAALVVGTADVRLWGMESRERYRRALDRAGVGLAADLSGVPGDASSVVVFRAGYVLDEALIADLTRTMPGTALIADDGSPAALHVTAAQAPAAAEALTAGRLPEDGAQRRLRPTELSSPFRNALRKRSDPYALPLRADTVRAIEWRMFMAAYKGATDFVTKFAWPPIAVHATRFCAQRGISPNTVTWVSLLFVILTFALFWHGHFLLGCLTAWIMTFLDTVDGKLARVTLTSSKLGEAFDHGIDHIHPPFWYWAWAVGLDAAGMPLAAPAAILGVIIGGYLLGRLQEGLFLLLFRIEMHIWRPLDTRFRLITARRNPNVFLLMIFAIAGAPDTGLVAVALWTLISLAFHFVRIYQAWIESRSRPIVSWMADLSPGPNGAA